MKRRYANRHDGDYFQDRIETEYFSGYISHVKLKNVVKPIYITNDIHTICIKDNDYEWFGLYPDEGKYAITVVYDNKHNIVEWYFDVAKNIGLEKGIPYEDDLYLDMVITPDGKRIVLDEDELLMAAKTGDITEEDVDDAYKTLEFITNKYANNFHELKNFTEGLFNFVNRKD